MGIAEENTRIVVTIPKELKTLAERKAQEESRPLSNLIVYLLNEYTKTIAPYRLSVKEHFLKNLEKKRGTGIVVPISMYVRIKRKSAENERYIGHLFNTKFSPERNEVLFTVNKIDEDEHKDRLIQWYKDFYDFISKYPSDYCLYLHDERKRDYRVDGEYQPKYRWIYNYEDYRYGFNEPQKAFNMRNKKTIGHCVTCSEPILAWHDHFLVSAGEQYCSTKCLGIKDFFD